MVMAAPQKFIKMVSFEHREKDDESVCCSISDTVLAKLFPGRIF